MASPPGELSAEQKLAALQTEFKRMLPVKVEAIEHLWNSILAGDEECRFHIQLQNV